MNFKHYRTKNRLTQEDVAKAIGIPKKTYQNYEYEVRKADSEVLCALADLYEISLDELIGRNQLAVDDPAIEAEKHLLTVYRSMNQDGQRTLLAIAETLSGIFGADGAEA